MGNGKGNKKRGLLDSLLKNLIDEIDETPESHRAQARTWMRDSTTKMHQKHEERLAHRRAQPWFRRHNDFLWISGIILGILALSALIGFLTE